MRNWYRNREARSQLGAMRPSRRDVDIERVGSSNDSQCDVPGLSGDSSVSRTVNVVVGSVMFRYRCWS